MEKKKLFVSLPMRDRDLEDIRSDMMTITNFISFQLDEDYELINTLMNDEPSVDIEDPSVWYLGRSISMLAEADLVVFDSSWREARGCIIEHMVCALYNIPYVDISMNYHEDEDFVNDQTYDINEAARLNELLSEEYEQASGQTEDFEDALGFEPMMEHGANTDILEEESPESSRRQKIADILKRRRNRIKRLSEEVEDNPYAKHADIDIVTIDELGEDLDIDKLEPGEYDADAYFEHSGVKGQKWGIRRYQNPDGSLTPLGREHYGYKGPEDTVFISGSSKTQFEDSGYYRKNLSDEIRKRIDNEILQNSHIIVGDAPGIDRQVQDYLKKSNYSNVEIFGPGNKEVRYKADARWKSTTIDNPDADPNSKEWLAAKDYVMSEIADRGIAIVLDEGAKATRKNVDRLMSDNKDVYVYELSKRGSSYDRRIH